MARKKIERLFSGKFTNQITLQKRNAKSEYVDSLVIRRFGYCLNAKKVVPDIMIMSELHNSERLTDSLSNEFIKQHDITKEEHEKYKKLVQNLRDSVRKIEEKKQIKSVLFWLSCATEKATNIKHLSKNLDDEIDSILKELDIFKNEMKRIKLLNRKILTQEAKEKRLEIEALHAEAILINNTFNQIRDRDNH